MRNVKRCCQGCVVTTGQRQGVAFCVGFSTSSTARRGRNFCFATHTLRPDRVAPRLGARAAPRSHQRNTLEGQPPPLKGRPWSAEGRMATVKSALHARSLETGVSPESTAGAPTGLVFERYFTTDGKGSPF